MRPRPTLPTWWRFTLRLNTPAWIGGAKARQVDEDLPLRPASVRGALRHWLRLALAEVLGGGESDAARQRALKELRSLEAVLFGAVGASGAEGSRVLIKPPMGGRVGGMNEVLAGETAPGSRYINSQGRGHKPSQTRAFRSKDWPGVCYMGYGIVDKGPSTTGLVTDDSQNGEHPIHLTVGLQVRSTDTEAQREALRGALGAVLWLWGNLGGIGARSRRGWGGVELLPEGTVPVEWAGLFSAQRPASRVAALNALNRGLECAVQKIKSFALAFNARPAPRPLPEIRTTAGIQMLRSIPEDHGSGRDAIERAGIIFSGFRRGLERGQPEQVPFDGDNAVRRAAESGQLNRTFGRAAFGLPLEYRPALLRYRTVRMNPNPPRGLRAARGGCDRMPSGLLFRVVRLADQGAKRRFFMLLVYLEEGRAPLGGCGLSVAVQGGRPINAPNPGDKVVMDFLNLAVKPGGGQ